MIRIGICEDERQQRQVLEEMVCRIADKLNLNREVKCFQSGEELLAEIDLSGSMDIVLLDIEMPKLNGIETFERMKEFAGDIPVIFLTASGQESDVVSAIRLGAVNYLKKPFEPQELIRRVAQELEEQ